MQCSEPFQWDEVRVFLALFREGSLGAAARRLGVDASTVSRRLSAFEAELGTTLFDRTRDGMLPTNAAEQVLAAAEEAERGIMEFSRATTSFEREVEGLVRITAPPGFVELFLAPLLVELYERHPRIRVEAGASQALVDLTRREADIALRTIKPSAGDLMVTQFYRAPWRVYAAPEYARELKTLRDLSSARWVSWGGAFAHIPPAHWYTRHVRGEPLLRSNSLLAQLKAAESGLGLVLAPEPTAALFELSELKLGPALKRARHELPVDELWLVGHRALRYVPRVDAVWSFLLEHARRKAGASRTQ